MHFFKKTFAIFTIANLLLSLNPAPALGFDISSLLSNLGGASDTTNFGQAGVLAGLVDVPSPSEATSEVLNSLGFDQQEVRKFAKQSNATAYKDDGPQVELTFIPAAPEPGKKITAIASATGFSNAPKNQYFTWFLKREVCKKKEICDTNEDGKLDLNNKDFYCCDNNQDKEIDIEDYKIEAARLIASGDFQWQQLLGSDDPACSNSQPPAHCSLPRTTPTSSGDGDGDGYQAITGGEDQKGKSGHCFIHNIATGEDTEMEECDHLFPTYPTSTHIDTKLGEDTTFTVQEEDFWRTDSTNKDTSGSGIVDEASVVGLGKMEFNWTYSPGDKIGVAVEGVALAPTTEKDSSFKTMWAITNNPPIEPEWENDTSRHAGDGRLAYDFDQPGNAFCGGDGKECNITIRCSSEPIDSISGGFINPGIPSIAACDWGEPTNCSVSATNPYVKKVDYYFCSGDPGCASTCGFCIKNQQTSSNRSFYWNGAVDYSGHLLILLDKTYGDNCQICLGSTCYATQRRVGMIRKKLTVNSINAVLEEALIEPTTGTDYKKITNNLSVNNSNPQYDNTPGGGNSDTLTFRSNATNTENSKFTNYKWDLAVATDSGASD